MISDTVNDCYMLLQCNSKGLLVFYHSDLASKENLKWGKNVLN